MQSNSNEEYRKKALDRQKFQAHNGTIRYEFPEMVPVMEESKAHMEDIHKNVVSNMLNKCTGQYCSYPNQLTRSDLTQFLTMYGNYEEIINELVPDTVERHREAIKLGKVMLQVGQETIDEWQTRRANGNVVWVEEEAL